MEKRIISEIRRKYITESAESRKDPRFALLLVFEHITEDGKHFLIKYNVNAIATIMHEMLSEVMKSSMRYGEEAHLNLGFSGAQKRESCTVELFEKKLLCIQGISRAKTVR